MKWFGQKIGFKSCITNFFSTIDDGIHPTASESLLLRGTRTCTTRYNFLVALFRAFFLELGPSNSCFIRKVGKTQDEHSDGLYNNHWRSSSHLSGEWENQQNKKFTLKKRHVTLVKNSLETLSVALIFQIVTTENRRPVKKTKKKHRKRSVPRTRFKFEIVLILLFLVVYSASARIY